MDIADTEDVFAVLQFFYTAFTKPEVFHSKQG